jgi:hypothetical protein
MVLTASPAGLADGLHEAAVLVTSSALATPQTVRVGLYVSSVASATTFVTPPSVGVVSVMGIQFNDNWVVDPYRPWTYNALSNGTIAIDHVYTGARVDTISVPGAIYGSTALSDDGTELFVLNSTSKALDVINLAARNVTRTLPLPSSPNTKPFEWNRVKFARIAGRSVLIASGMDGPAPFIGQAFILDAGNGAILGTIGCMATERSVITVSADHRAVFISDAGLSGILEVRPALLLANSVGSFFGACRGRAEAGGVAGLQDIVSNADGSRVYGAWGTDRFIRKFSFSNGVLTQTQPFEDWPNNVQNFPANVVVDWRGRVITITTDRLRAYNADDSFAFSGLVPNHPALRADARSVRVSSDGLRLLGGGAMLDLP